MIETHAFGDFVPKNAKYLMLGSFTAKKADTNSDYDWYYGSKRNQLWHIIEQVYNLKLENSTVRKELFTKLGLAMSDMIKQCERRDGNSSDNNLINIVYNTEGITNILTNNKIQKIFFSSRFVEKEFKKRFKDLINKFPDIELITLPSPSPRYAAMSKSEKIRRYKELFPKV